MERIENEKQQYLNHVQRLYDCVEHFFSMHRKMGLERGEVNNEWIPRLLNDFIEMKFRNSPEFNSVMRLVKTLFFTDGYFKNNGISSAFVFEVSNLDGQQSGKFLPRIGDFLVGLYFPPEHYPKGEDGAYPQVEIMVNDHVYENIQLDGTNRLYKPIGGNRFWLHLHMMKANTVTVHTNGKPFQIVEILDNTGKGPLYSYYFDVGFTCPTGTFFYNNGFELWKLKAGYFGDKYKCTEINYSYVRAAMIIKRCFISYMKRKKRQIVSAEIKFRPGFGYEALKLVEKYTDDQRFRK